MLDVEGLSAGYGQVSVLRDVSLRCETGTVVALLGPNGAGKTTFLRSISGFLRPTSGRVMLGDQDITNWKANKIAKAGVCHVPEGRGIFPSLSLRDNLTLFAPRGMGDEAVERAASSFPVLGKRLKQTAGSLSGGEQQMLAIVRAYLTDPKLVLVDEASMGLAPLVVDGLFEFLASIAQTGTTLLIVEQYVSRALELADTVCLLNHGQVAYNGPSAGLDGEEIFERYLGVEV
jgi:branched-chain amino acid transport system ATP-binding protein